MAIATWPSTIPQSALISSFSDSVGEGRIITKTSTGVGKRRAFWAGLKALSLSYNMTQQQYLDLLSFYQTTVRNGVDPFYITGFPATGSFLYGDDGTIITDDSDDPLLFANNQLVMFADQQPIRRSQAYTTDLFKVDVNLQVLP